MMIIQRGLGRGTTGTNKIEGRYGVQETVQMVSCLRNYTHKSMSSTVLSPNVSLFGDPAVL